VTQIPEAVSIITKERDRTAAEQAAFRDFSARVTALNATTIKFAGASHRGTVPSSGVRKDTQIEAVRAAYRDTVMATPHYGEEYDEPLVENMDAEFGTDLAAIVDTNEILTPQLQDALLQASETAQRDRAAFRQTLDREYSRLIDGRETLRDISETIERLSTASLAQRSFDDLLDIRRRLKDLEVDCKELLTDRQCQLHDGAPRNGIPLQEYLHTAQIWTFPVLNDTLDCLRRLREVRASIARIISCRC
jgi:hypothetical protein